VAIQDAELADDVAEVVVDRPLGDSKLKGDVAAG